MRLSIKTKILIIMLAVGFIPGMVGVFSTYTKGSDVFRHSTAHSLTHEANQIAFGIRTLIEKEASEGMLIAAHPAVRTLVQGPADQPEELKQAAIQFIGLEGEKEGHANISIYDSNGQQRLQIGPTPHTAEALQEAMALLQHSPYIGIVGAPLKNPDNGSLYIPLHIPIRVKQSGALLGAIAIHLEVADFFNLEHLHAPGELAHFNLVITSGQVIYDPLVSQQQPPLIQHVIQKITANGNNWFVETDEHGLESVFAYAPIDLGKDRGLIYIGENRLYVVFTAPVSEAFDKPIREVLFGAAIPGFVFAAFLIFIIYLALKKTVSPIATLKEGATFIGSGHLEHRIDIHTGDEIEELADAFNQMTARLQTSYQNLEKKVEWRTLELQESNLKLEKASQLKSQFLASMSHELRTPLNVIIGFSEVLADNSFGALNEKQQKYLDNINKSGKHLLDIINEILDLSKIEAGKMELNLAEFPVQETMEEILGLVAHLAKDREVDLRLNSADEPKSIVADSLRFKQIMLNLLSNAIKFTPSGGSVQVTTEKDQPYIKISVSDTGIGIADSDQKLIFETFRQIDSSATRSYEGTGLGLALVKKFVELHGGDIMVESELNKGSTFTFRIPIAGPEAGASHDES